MHWFWRVTIAVIAGNVAGVAGLAFCIGVLGHALKSIGIANPTPLSYVFIFTFITAAVLGVDAFLPRSSLAEALPSETRCRKCGYILRGLSEPRCPECGEQI